VTPKRFRGTRWYPEAVVAYTIRTFGDPVLKQRARDVTDIDADLARVVHTMVDTMYEANGVGLAAPQVGIQKRFFTYDVGEGPGVLINPEIVDAHGEWTYEEGCLSVPGLHFEIVRPKVVTVRGLDVDGEEVVIEGDELMGRLLLHEIDHLDGVLLLERLEPDVRKEALRELRRRDALEAVPAPVGGARDGDDGNRRL
jgi:peptide deformylase